MVWSYFQIFDMEKGELLIQRALLYGIQSGNWKPYGRKIAEFKRNVFNRIV